MLRTFQNTGMVFSFSMAILIASRSIPRQVAFAIFVGTAKLHGHVAAVFTGGLHAAFYASMSFLLLAALLSASRGRRGFVQRAGRPGGPGRPEVTGVAPRVEAADPRS
jgi:hypothetical protein